MVWRVCPYCATEVEIPDPGEMWWQNPPYNSSSPFPSEELQFQLIIDTSNPTHECPQKR